MSYELYHTLFLATAIGAAVMLLVSVVLFVKLRIWAVIGGLVRRPNQKTAARGAAGRGATARLRAGTGEQRGVAMTKKIQTAEATTVLTAAPTTVLADPEPPAATPAPPVLQPSTGTTVLGTDGFCVVCDITYVHTNEIVF